MMERRIFIRLRHRVLAHPGDIITVGDAAQIEEATSAEKETFGYAALSGERKR